MRDLGKNIRIDLACIYMTGIVRHKLLMNVILVSSWNQLREYS